MTHRFQLVIAFAVLAGAWGSLPEAVHGQQAELPLVTKVYPVADMLLPTPDYEYSGRLPATGGGAVRGGGVLGEEEARRGVARKRDLALFGGCGVQAHVDLALRGGLQHQLGVAAGEFDRLAEGLIEKDQRVCDEVDDSGIVAGVEVVAALVDELGDRLVVLVTEKRGRVLEQALRGGSSRLVPLARQIPGSHRWVG